MGYNLPAHLTFIKNIESLRTQYPNHHPDRIKLIHLLESMAVFAKTEELIGAYIYGLESITNGYWFFDPQHKRGIFFNSGSTFYSLLFSHLEISENNQLSDIDKLIYLMKFYQFFHQNKTLLNPFINEEKIIQAIQSVFKKISKEVDCLIKAIPCENKLDNKMKNILNTYLNNQSHNEERIFLAEFAKFLAESSPAEEKKEFSNLLARSMRIKIGFLLFILLSIENTYIMRAPNNSQLYTLASDALNIKHSIQIDNETKLICLSTLESFINDNHTAKLLEEYLQKNVDINLHNLRSQLFDMIENIQHHAKKKISSLTYGAAAMGALIMASPSYGLGFTFSKVATQTNFIFSTKHFLSDIISDVSKQSFNNTGHHLTHFAANTVVDYTVERGCTKMFETVGMLIGAIMGGGTGLIVFDFSYQTISSLCDLCKIIFPILKTDYPDFAEKFDIKLLDCLLSLPPEVFSNLNKQKLENTAIKELSFSTNLAKT
jgi:hypothetical protein